MTLKRHSMHRTFIYLSGVRPLFSLSPNLNILRTTLMEQYYTRCWIMFSLSIHLAISAEYEDLAIDLIQRVTHSAVCRDNVAVIFRKSPPYPPSYCDFVMFTDTFCPLVEVNRILMSRSVVYLPVTIYTGSVQYSRCVCVCVCVCV